MPVPTMRVMALLASSLLLVMAIAGCGSDKATTPPYSWPADFPATPDQLLANFVTAYETMDAAALAATLSPDHITILQASTTTQFPDVGSTLDLTEETRIHERMFSQHDVTDPDGMLIPGIQTISFQTFARQGDWAISAPTDVIANTPYALYDVVVLFDRGQTYSTMKVQGQLKVYAVARDSTTHGETRTFHQLRAQVDLTQNWAKAAGTETSCWGAVKALFR